MSPLPSEGFVPFCVLEIEKSKTQHEIIIPKTNLIMQLICLGMVDLALFPCVIKRTSWMSLAAENCSSGETFY